MSYLSQYSFAAHHMDTFLYYLLNIYLLIQLWRFLKVLSNICSDIYWVYFIFYNIQMLSSLLYVWTLQWHESLDGDCKQLKKCIEIARSCCHHDPHSRPTIHNIILMLDETETMIQMIPPSINTEPRNDPMSSLYQVCSFK